MVLNASWPVNLMIIPKSGSVPASVYNYSKIQAAIDNMATGRTCFVAMGDSNQIRSNHGWDDGMFQALGRAGFACYGTNLYPGSESGFTGSDVGSNSKYFGNAGLTSWMTTTFTNSNLNDYNLNADGSSNSLTMQAAEIYANPPSNQNNGIIVGGANYSFIPGRKSYINLQSTDLRYRVVYGRRLGGSGGQLDPSVRIGGVPNYNQISTGIVSTVGGSDTPLTYVSAAINGSVNIPVGSEIQCGPTKLTGASSTVSPAWVFYQEVIDNTVTAGWRHTHIFAQGAQSAFDMATWIWGRTDNALMTYFQTIEATTNGGYVLFYIQTAANDTSETNASYGGGFTPGSSRAAYKDNVDFIVNRAKEGWALGGFDASRLKILIIPGHPLGAGFATEQQNYVDAAKEVSDAYDGVAVHDTRVFTSNAQMITRSYTEASTDIYHLNPRGYAALTRQMFADMGKGTMPTYPAVSCADNGNSAYLSKASNLTGLTDLQSGTLVFTLYNDNGINLATQGRILQGCDASNNVIFDLEITNSVSTPFVRLRIYNTNGAATQVSLWPVQLMGINYSTRRMHYMISWNTVGQLYTVMVNEKEIVGGSSLVSSGIPALSSITQWTMFAARTGASKMDGALGDFWLHFGTYTDFNVELNRRYFTDLNGNPLPIPDNGIVAGLTPNLFMRGTDMATGNNRGSGGNFTVNGSFTTSNIEG